MDWIYSKFISPNCSDVLVQQPASIASNDFLTLRAFDFFSRSSSGQKEIEYSGLHNEDVIPFLHPLDSINTRTQSASKIIFDQFFVPFWLLYKPLGSSDSSASLGTRRNPLSYSSATNPNAIVQEIQSPEEIAASMRNSPLALMGKVTYLFSLV